MIKNKILKLISLEHCKDGIYFSNELPLFFDIENIAKQLQIEVWLEDTTIRIDNSKEYIR